MSGLFRVACHMEDLSLFTRHLAGAMTARAPLHEILRAYACDSENSALRRAVEKMTARVEAGVDLSAAMEEQGAVFPAAYRRLVKLGEKGGTLGGVMSQLADSLDAGLRTYEYFRRAAIYPLLIAILMFVDICFVMVALLPKMQDIHQTLGVSLAWPMGAMLEPAFFKGLMIAFGLVLLVAIGFLIATVLGLSVTGFGYGRWQLQLPLVGPVLRKAETARFAGNLALLLDNHVPLAEALGLLADATHNTYVRAAIEDLARRYESGESLRDLIANQPLFPASMAVMIGGAEDRGGLALTLHSLSRSYSDRASFGLTVIREILEPMLLLTIGLLVGLILLALYSPLFNMARIIT